MKKIYTILAVFLCMFAAYAQAAGTSTIWGAPHTTVSTANRMPVDTSNLSGPGYNSLGDILNLINGDCSVDATTAHITCLYTSGSAFATVAKTGSASDLLTGTLPAARLPLPTNSTPGGVESVALVGSKWVQYIDTSGVPHLAQPLDADLGMQDLVNNNATISQHGFLKKLSGDSATYMDGTGNWTSPSAFTTIDFTGDGTVLRSTPSSGPHMAATLANAAANTLLGNGTGSSAAPTYLSAPSCSTSSSALQWTSGSGLACNTAIAASTVTTNANLTGPITSVGNATSVAGAAAGKVYAGATPSFTATPVLGVNASTAGTLGLANGGGSGATVTIQNLGATAAYNWNLPTTAGGVGDILTSGGGTTNSMVWLPDVATGQVLTSGGTGTIPAYSATLPSAVQGNITSVGALASGSITTGFTTIQAAQGGTGQTSVANAFSSFFKSVATTLGDIVYGGASGAPTRLGGNTTSTAQFLTSTGSGGLATAPTWTTPTCSNLSNAAASCSTDTTNASNITSGTLAFAQHPASIKYITAAMINTAGGI